MVFCFENLPTMRKNSEMLVIGEGILAKSFRIVSSKTISSVPNNTIAESK